MNSYTRLTLAALLGLACASPQTAEAQTQIRTQAKAQGEAIADLRGQLHAHPRYWEDYWSWYDTTYRPYYHGRSSIRQQYTDPRDRGYFGLRYNGRDIEDYQDWRDDYYRDRAARDRQSAAVRRNGSYDDFDDWRNDRDRDYYRSGQYQNQRGSDDDFSGRAGSKSYSGYGEAAGYGVWR